MKISLLLTVLLCSITVSGLQSPTDSLLRLLSKAKEDTVRVNLLTELSDEFFNSNPDSIFLFANEGLKIAQSAGYLDGEIRCKEKIGNYWWAVGDYATAVKLQLQVLEFYKSKNDTVKIAQIYSSLLNSYRDQGDYKEALHYSSLMLQVIPKELEFVLAVANAMKGSVYYEMNNFDSAHFYLTKALDYPHRFSEGWILLMNGRLYAKMKKTDTALGYYWQSFESLRADNNYKDLAGAFISTGMLYGQTGNRDSAIFYGMQGLEIAQKKKFNKETVESYLLLSTAFEKTNAKTALEYYKLAIIGKESLFNQEKQKQLLSYKFNEELRQSEIKNAQQQAMNKSKILILLVLLICFVLFVIILIRNNRHKQKLNLLLYQQKEEIQSALTELKAAQSQLIQSEKMASLGELTAGIAHEIQNPLNFVNNFSEVNTELIEELKSEKSKLKSERDEQLESELLNDIAENEKKINHHGKRADAIVKGMLQHSQTSTGQKEPTDINKLADEYLRLSYHGLRAKDNTFNATLKTGFDETIGNINIIPQDIGRVLWNLYNNAFYAIAEKKKQQGEDFDATVSVSIKKMNGKVEIIVKDNGNGIPQKIVDKIFQPFFTTKPTGQGTGLGLSLAYDIIKAHGGEIKVESKEGLGTEFIIQLLLNTTL